MWPPLAVGALLVGAGAGVAVGLAVDDERRRDPPGESEPTPFEGEVVGTLTTSVDDLAAGDSVDTEFIGLDGYGDWDAVEFSVG